MSTAVMAPPEVMAEARVETRVDFIEEIRLRTWARKNYSPAQDRQQDWHPVILDEMRQMDREQN